MHLSSNKTRVTRTQHALRCCGSLGPVCIQGVVVAPRMHMGATIIASQPVVRITTSATTKKRMMSLPATFVQRISHGCRERAERGAVVLETHVRIAQSVNHRQHYRAVHFQHPYLDLNRGYTHSTNLAATVSLP